MVKSVPMIAPFSRYSLNNSTTLHIQAMLTTHFSFSSLFVRTTRHVHVTVPFSIDLLEFLCSTMHQEFYNLHAHVTYMYMYPLECTGMDFKRALLLHITAIRLCHELCFNLVRREKPYNTHSHPLHPPSDSQTYMYTSRPHCDASQELSNYRYVTFIVQYMANPLIPELQRVLNVRDRA